MAIAFVANRHSTGVAAVGTSEPLDMATAGAITVGNTLFLYIATDNTGQLPNVTGVSDPRGNFWTRVSNTTINPGADAGASVEVWVSRTQFAYTNGDDLTVSWDQNITRGAFRVNEFSGVAPQSTMTNVTGTGSGTTIGSLATSPLIGQMVIGAAAIETNTAITGDADVTNGAWSAIGTVVSNSGADLTSITLSEQYKIVTAGGAQNWAVTKTGAADWAAVSIVVPIQVLAAVTIPAGNPNYPCVAGYEGLPTKNITVPLDTGTGYDFTIDDTYIYPNAVGTDSMIAFASLESPRDGLSQHTIAWDIGFPENMHVTDDQVTTVTVPLSGATTNGSARISGVNIPAPTPAETLTAISSVGVGYIRLDDTESVQFIVDGPSLLARYPGMRIARMGIRYIAWKDDTDLPNPGVGMRVQWADGRNTAVGRATSYDYAYWLVNNYRSTSTYEYRSMGEINYIPPAPPGVFSDSDARSFMMGDLNAQTLAGNGTLFSITCTQGTDITQNAIFFDYIEVVLDLVPERRRGSAATLVTNIPYVLDSLVTLLGQSAPFNNPSGAFFEASGLSGSSPLVFFANSSGWTLRAREALTADGSDFFRALKVNPIDPLNTEAKYTGAEAVGVPLRLQALTQVRDTQDPAPVMELETIVSTLPVAFEDLDEYIPAVSMAPLALIASDGYIWPQFQTTGIPSELRVINGTTQTQYVIVNGATQFSYITVLVKDDPTQNTSETLLFSVQQPLATPIATASITVAQIRAAVDLGEGWKEVRATLSVPVTPTAGQVIIVMSTASNIAFTVQGSYPKTTNSGYNNSAANDNTRPTDSSVVLIGTYPTPTISLGTTAVTWTNPDNYVGNNYGVCRTLTYNVPSITWGRTGGCRGFDRYVIERSIDAGVSWQVVFVRSGTGTVADNFAPWDISPTVRQLIYRVTGYMDTAPQSSATAVTANWGGVCAAPGPVIGLSSNDIELWFTPVAEGSMDLEWTPLSPVNLIQLHGQDYNYPLRAPEDRGLSLSVPVLINQTFLCSPLTAPNLALSQAAGEILDNGVYAMSPLTFENLIVPIMRSSDAFVMKLPGGHTRWVTVEIGGMTVTTQNGMYIAELIITDVTPPSADPYSLEYA